MFVEESRGTVVTTTAGQANLRALAAIVGTFLRTITFRVPSFTTYWLLSSSFMEGNFSMLIFTSFGGI